jgi:hypothetical protein
MGPEPLKPWDELRRAEPVNERWVSVYERLMEAQEKIASARFAAGVSEEAIDAAMEAGASGEGESESGGELYFGTLTRYVEALGGRLVGDQAVFVEETITLPPLGR